MSESLWILVFTVLALVGLGFMLSFSIKKHDVKAKAQKKKKGRTRNLPQSRIPGK